MRYREKKWFCGDLRALLIIVERYHILLIQTGMISLVKELEENYKDNIEVK